MDKEAIARELLAAEISAENHRTATPERGLSHGLVQDTVALRTGGDWPVTVNGEVARRAIIAALTKPAATLSPAEPSPESREGVERYARAIRLYSGWCYKWGRDHDMVVATTVAKECAAMLAVLPADLPADDEEAALAITSLIRTQGPRP